MSRGRFLVRLEDSDAGILAGLSRGVPLPFDGAIVNADYLAPYPEQDPRRGKRPDELVDQLAAREVGWLVDPATAKLGHERALQRLRPRAANGPIAKAVELPLTPRLAFDTGEAEVLVDAAAAVQLRSPMLTDPLSRGPRRRRPSSGCESEVALPRTRAHRGQAPRRGLANNGELRP
jgi:hypothetical protein